MDFTEKENIPGLMIFIDFRKAFDTLEWSVLCNCLDSCLAFSLEQCNPYLTVSANRRPGLNVAFYLRRIKY